MIERYFTFKDFRSVGVDQFQHFDLNYLLDNSDSYGGVVTLIGENNSGKSNVLEALKVFGSKSYAPNDVPFHNLKDGVEPEICLFLKDHKLNVKARIKLKGKKQYLDMFKGDKQQYPEQKKLSKKTTELINYLLADEAKLKYQSNPNAAKVYRALEPLISKLRQNQLLNDNELAQLNQHAMSPYLAPIITEKFDQTFAESLVEDAKRDFSASLTAVNESKLSNEVSDIFKVKPVPRIFEYYDQIKIKGSDITSSVSSGVIQKPQFFEKLYDLLEEDSFDELKNAYLRFYESGMQRISILTNYSRKIREYIISCGLSKLSEIQ